MTRDYLYFGLVQFSIWYIHIFPFFIVFTHNALSILATGISVVQDRIIMYGRNSIWVPIETHVWYFVNIK